VSQRLTGPPGPQVLVVQRFTLGTIPEWRKCRLGMAIAYGAEK
jgi:hypothetical protein